MIEAVHAHISDVEIHKLTMFVGASIAGMLFAYYRRWSWEESKVKLHDYFWGDKHAMGRAITTLVILCGAAGGLDYLEPMSDFQIITAGIGIGILVPATVDSKRLQQVTDQEENVLEVPEEKVLSEDDPI